MRPYGNIRLFFETIDIATFRFNCTFFPQRKLHEENTHIPVYIGYSASVVVQ